MGMQLSSSIHEENKYICRDCHHPAQLITCTPFCLSAELRHDCHLVPQAQRFSRSDYKTLGLPPWAAPWKSTTSSFSYSSR
jgi:hypothetical protein